MLTFFAFSVCTMMLLGFAWQKRRMGVFDALVGDLHSLSQALGQGGEGTDLSVLLSAWEPMSLPGKFLKQRLGVMFERPPLRLGSSGVWLGELDHWFDEEVLSLDWLDLRRLQSIPSFFTGLGIFFTFLGLTVATFQLHPDEAGSLGQEVQRLLGGMSLAFSTSLTGIGCSLAWQVLIHRKQGALAGHTRWLRQFFRDWQRCAHATDAERLQLEQRQWLHRELSQNVQHWIKERQEETKGPQVAGVLQELTQSFAHQQEYLGRLVRTQEQLLEVTREMGQKAQAQAGSLTPDLLARQERFLRQTQAVFQSMAPAQEAQSGQMSHWLSVAERLERSAEHARKAQESLALSHQQVVEQYTMIRAHWEVFEEKLTLLDAAVEDGIRKLQQHLQLSLNTSFEQFDQHLGQSLEAFAHTLNQMDQAIKGLSPFLHSLTRLGQKP